MATYRMQRINKQLQREICLLLEYKIKNDVAKDAIITEVSCSKDLEVATVFFVTLDQKQRKAVLKALESAAGPIRSLLGKRLRLRQIPEIRFEIDSSVDYGRRIDALLDSIKESSNNELSAEDDQIDEFGE